MSLGIKFIVECCKKVRFDFHLHGARCPFTKLIIMGGSGERESRSDWIRGAGASTVELLQPACNRRVDGWVWGDEMMME